MSNLPLTRLALETLLPILNGPESAAFFIEPHASNTINVLWHDVARKKGRVHWFLDGFFMVNGFRRRFWDIILIWRRFILDSLHRVPAAIDVMILDRQGSSDPAGSPEIRRLPNIDVHLGTGYIICCWTNYIFEIIATQVQLASASQCGHSCRSCPTVTFDQMGEEHDAAESYLTKLHDTRGTTVNVVQLLGSEHDGRTLFGRLTLVLRFDPVLYHLFGPGNAVWRDLNSGWKDPPFDISSERRGREAEKGA
jgi:hypothetical protein